MYQFHRAQLADMPDAKPSTEPVLSAKWSSADQSVLQCVPCWGLRYFSTFSLIQSTWEGKLTERLVVKHYSKCLIFHGDLTNQQRSVFQSLSAEVNSHTSEEGNMVQGWMSGHGRQDLVQISQRGILEVQWQVYLS